MNWSTLLSYKRLGKEKKKSNPDQKRSEWQKDYDRIVFSSAFRRLQDKTQVFPLSESDYPRTRLTHSIESSIVGRSLGIEVGFRLQKKYSNIFGENLLSPYDIGAIVAAASLAHDIGNPPFGHSGEEAIQTWFSAENDKRESKFKHLEKEQKLDFLNFEGNAQGFRILTSLQRPKQSGGLQLTYATLGAYSKYPRESFVKKANSKISGASSKKHGFFQIDKSNFLKVANKNKLKPKKRNSVWFRHPLAFLVEAADDICYQIVDLEDAFLLRHVNFGEVRDHLSKLLNEDIGRSFLERKSVSDQEKVEYLRAKAINSLIGKVVTKFDEKESAILKGEFDKPLLEEIKEKSVLEKLDKFNKKEVYKLRKVVSIEMAGFKVLGELLNLFVPAAFDLILKGKKASPKSRKVAEFVLGNKDFEEFKKKSPYEALIKVTDYIAGMSDSFAVATYRQITGMSLPNR
ncbi:deoxyguanosinetriphosphate triphosphohydrolase [Nitrospina sp. 32_T5]|uniref:deoxyguanosinetriphosphate triphosphohydrolase n=1 Tax=unclassified Nitrospina TaxID=2638683 RepID=UPI003F9668E6